MAIDADDRETFDAASDLIVGGILIALALGFGLGTILSVVLRLFWPWFSLVLSLITIVLFCWGGKVLKRSVIQEGSSPARWTRKDLLVLAVSILAIVLLALLFVLFPGIGEALNSINRS